MLDLRVESDPVSCRLVGEWLRGLAGGMWESVEGIDHARARSEGSWTGQTADAFRDRMSAASREADQAAGATDRFGSALQVFADDIDTVRSRMAVARQVAGAAGLPVTGEGIGEPSGMGRADARQVAAYQEATVIVAEARDIETTAHTTLASSVQANTADLSMKVLDGLTGTVGALYGQHLAWVARAARYERIADQWDRLLANTTLSTNGRLTALGKSARAELDAQKALNTARTNHAPIKFLPQGAKEVFGANVGSNLKNFRYLNRLAPALEKVPYVGLGFTGLGVVFAGAEGKSMTQAAVSGGASFAAGTLATEGALAGLEMISVAGGPATILAVGAGIAVAYGVGWVVDNWGDDIAEATKDAATSVYHAGQYAERTVEAGLNQAADEVEKGLGKIGHALGHIF